VARPGNAARPIARPERRLAERLYSAPPRAAVWPGFAADAYLDYHRTLTDEGGILITYKDIDVRFRHIVWRLLAWSVSTGIAGWAVFDQMPLHSQWIAVGCLFGVAVVNAFIVAKPVELYRSIEIRPDCMILEGGDTFWLGVMEEGWPEFRDDDKGNQILCGSYGTRFVEYLTVRRFDEHDRTPEVFAAHLQEAMQQLWSPSLTLGTVQRGSPPGQ
jgi:hypothetical protein